MKYNQKLPKKVEKQLDDYIKRIKAIKWFQPANDIKKVEVEKQVKLVLEGFGVKAKLEFKQLKTKDDWDAAWGAAWDTAWDTAWNTAWDTAWDTAWNTAWNTARVAAWGAARDAARDAAWVAAWFAARVATWGAARGAARVAARVAARGANDVLVLNLKDYKNKYPKGTFINLIPLWEMGLYPIGVVDKKFIIYVPASKNEFPKELNSNIK